MAQPGVVERAAAERRAREPDTRSGYRWICWTRTTSPGRKPRISCFAGCIGLRRRRCGGSRKELKTNGIKRTMVRLSTVEGRTGRHSYTGRTAQWQRQPQPLRSVL